MPITHAFVNGKADGADTTVTRPSDWNANHVGSLYGQTTSYPTTFTGDTIDGSSTTPYVDVSAFDVKEVLNSRILHLRSLGAAGATDHRVRVTLGTPKAAAFDVRTAISYVQNAFGAAFDNYLECRLSDASDAQIAIVRILPSSSTAVSADNGQLPLAARVNGSSAPSAGANIGTFLRIGETLTARFVRDGSNVISFYLGVGTAPMTLAPVSVYSTAQPFTATVSGTLARVEYSIHTPAGTTSAVQYDAYVDHLASV